MLFIIPLLFPINTFSASRVFNENDKTPTPAKTINDGVDYVPSKTLVVFSHHFASIAGAGPIVGPVVLFFMVFIPPGCGFFLVQYL